MVLPVGVDHFASNEYWIGFHKSMNVSQDIRVRVLLFNPIPREHLSTLSFLEEVSALNISYKVNKDPFSYTS